MDITKTVDVLVLSLKHRNIYYYYKMFMYIVKLRYQSEVTIYLRSMKLVNLCDQHLIKFANHGVVMLSYFSVVVPMNQLNFSVKEDGEHRLIMQIMTHVVGVGLGYSYKYLNKYVPPPGALST